MGGFAILFYCSWVAAEETAAVLNKKLLLLLGIVLWDNIPVLVVQWVDGRATPRLSSNTRSGTSK